MAHYAPATIDVSITDGDVSITINGNETHPTSVSELRQAAHKENDPWPYLFQQIAVQLDAADCDFDSVGDIKTKAEAGSYLY